MANLTVREFGEMMAQKAGRDAAMGEIQQTIDACEREWDLDARILIGSRRDEHDAVVAKATAGLNAWKVQP